MPPADSRSRLIERRIAGVGIAVATLFTAIVLIWRIGYDDAPLSSPFPPLPATSRWGAFDLYLWVGPAGLLIAAAVVAGLMIHWITGRRGATAWIGVGLPILICLQTAAIFAPFGALTVRRSSRLAKFIEEPAIHSRAVALSVIMTMVLAAAFVCVAHLRRTPPIVRQLAVSAAGILATILLHISWVLWVLPLTNQWSPAEWRRPDLLTTFRPCRGALLWKAPEQERDSLPTPVVRVVDIWLHFDDPTSSGVSVWAVSGPREWRDGYFWLRLPEVAELRVRVDDPALQSCDSRPRPERVEPEPWHTVGFP